MEPAQLRGRRLQQLHALAVVAAAHRHAPQKDVDERDALPVSGGAPHPARAL